MSSEGISRRKFLQQAGILSLASLLVPCEVLGYQEARTPPVVLTGFGPFGGRQINSSTEIVKHFVQYPPANIDAHFVYNLPVDKPVNPSAAKYLTNFLSGFPQGAILIMMGENFILNGSAGRLEQTAHYDNKSRRDDADDCLTRRRLNQSLYDTIQKKSNSVVAEGDEGHRAILFPGASDVAGNFVCEITMALMCDLSYRLARQTPKIPLLPIFLHVPALGKDTQPYKETLDFLALLISTSVQFFIANQANPECFVNVTFPNRSPESRVGCNEISEVALIHRANVGWGPRIRANRKNK